jgi:hypothetical protein
MKLQINYKQSTFALYVLMMSFKHILNHSDALELT